MGGNPLYWTDRNGLNPEAAAAAAAVAVWCARTPSCAAAVMYLICRATGGCSPATLPPGYNNDSHSDSDDGADLPHCPPDSDSGNKIPNDELQAPPNKRGNAPTGNDGYPVELHHRDQNPNGPLDEMTQTDHRRGDNFKKNHSNTGQEASKIDRNKARQEQRDYWKNEWDSGRFDGL